MELDLKEIRKNLDTIDDQLITLFRNRMELSSQVAAYKKENGMPIWIPAANARLSTGFLLLPAKNLSIMPNCFIRPSLTSAVPIRRNCCALPPLW